jgi:ABC-2 type transport system ATP-binding protein
LNNDPIVEVKGVHKSFKNVHAVRGINISIPKGQFLSILGPNGAGKTTLVEMIEGIQKPDAGSIHILGKKWNGNESELRKVIGLSLQETYFIDKITVTETLTLFASFYGLNNQRVMEIIGMMGLEEKQKSNVVNLSGGQKQRLALGIALINNPQVLLLDEPTSGLDPNARHEIWKILLDLKQNNHTTIILTTHHMEEAEQLSDYVIIMNEGSILKEGTLDQILYNGNSKNLIEFSFDNQNSLLNNLYSNAPFNIDIDQMAGKGKVILEDLESELSILLNYFKENDLKIKNLEFRKQTLDDLFISLTGRRINE